MIIRYYLLNLTEIRGNSKLSTIRSDRRGKCMRRYSSGKSPNLTWQMEANLGQNFEDFVAKIIMAQLRQLRRKFLTECISLPCKSGKRNEISRNRDAMFCNVQNHIFIMIDSF